jgi:single-stranded-DNA-specific exonuclease
VRGDGVVSVVEIMQGAPDMFLHYGGHFASGGFAVEEGKVHELGNRLAASYEALRKAAREEKETQIDRELSLGEVVRAQRALLDLAPFGVGNEKPLFVLPGVSIGSARSFGKSGDHLELEFKGDLGTRVSGVSFFSTPDSFTKKPEQGGRADIVGHVELDWRGKPRVRVVDII